MAENICYNCFHEKTQGGACPVCGYSPEQDRDKYPLALPHGTILNGKYILGRVLGQGGFGITYVAQDWKAKKRVAVKEYLPDTMATRIEGHTVSAYSGQREESFNYGKECFLSEAKTLAEFIGNENIVRIHSYFEENGTAYFVMEYVDGVSFQTYIRDQGGKIDWQDAGRIMFPIMDALGAVHAKGIIHRDVTPDNIFITEDGTVKLLDFGAARYSLGDRSRSLDVVLKHGYAPKEQYTRRGRQGPYTDVYSVAACFYFAVTGHKPPDSIERLDEDDLIPPSSLGVKVSEAQEDALLKGLSVQAADRYQSMADFKAAMTAGEEPEDTADVVVAGNAATQKESQTSVQPAESNGPQKESGTSDTPKAAAKSQKVMAGLREKKLVVPVAVAAAALVVVAAAVAIGVQGAYKKPAGNADSVLVDADPGDLTSKADAETLEVKDGISEAGASDEAKEPKEETIYLVTVSDEWNKYNGYRYRYEYTYDQKGNELTVMCKDVTFYSSYLYRETTYDDIGNVLVKTQYHEDGTFYQNQFTYDSAGNLLTRTDHESDGTGSRQKQYAYDDNGNLLFTKYYREDGTLSVEDTYDAAGNTITSTVYKEDGNTISIQYRSLYDDRGNEVVWAKYDAYDNVLERSERTYDENGNTLIWDYYGTMFSDTVELCSRKEYTYDEAGNVLTETETYYSDDGPTEEKTLYSYDYDEYGNVVKEITYAEQADAEHIIWISMKEYKAITIPSE